MRGSPSRLYGLPAVDGIIPAHAGLTIRLVGRLCGRWDHPRACGAHLRALVSHVCMRGLSPRMRGSPISQLTGWDAYGIIPAHAGLTRR